MAKNKRVLNIDMQIDQVQAKMNNLAERAVKKAEKSMEEYAYKIMLRARWYAPEETGALGAESSWRVDKQKVGNRRAIFVVELKDNAKREDGKAVSQYAEIMHNSTNYKIRGYDKTNKPIYSRAKARRSPPPGQPWLTTGTSGQKYIGRLFLSRAVNQYRLATSNAMIEAIKESLR